MTRIKNDGWPLDRTVRGSLTEALKKIQSEIRCALHFPSDEQLKSDTCRTVEQQRSGMKVDPDEINGQISYELGSLYFLQHKYSEAQAAFSQTRLCVDKYGIGKSGSFSISQSDWLTGR